MSDPTQPPITSPALPPRSRASVIGGVLGSLGMVAIVSTIFTYLLTRELGWMIWGKLLFGTVALAVYGLTNRQALGRVASRSTVYTTASIATTAGFLGIMLAANLVGVLTSRDFDLTAEQIFSLADQTQGVLTRLDRDVVITGFFRPEEVERGALTELVKRYQGHTKHLELHIENPERAPEAVKEHQITQAGPRVVVTSGDQKTKLKDLTEEELTNAIVRVAGRSSKKIAFLTGHNEAELASAQAEGYRDAVDALRVEGYEVVNLTLYDKNAVPEDNAVVIVAAPRRELLPPELEMLRGWLLKGGRLMVMLEPGMDAGLRPLLADWNVALGDDVVVDPNPMSKAFGFGPEMPIIQKLEPHAITRGMKLSVAFPTVSSVRGLPGAKGTKTVELAKTSAESWAAKTRGGEGSVRGPDDLAGPVPVMTLATQPAKLVAGGVSPQARLLVVGDHEFANNRFLSVLGNKDLFLNAVNWLVEEEERISIRPRARAASRLFLTETEATFIKFFALDIVPMLLLAVGVAVRRLHKR